MESLIPNYKFFLQLPYSIWVTPMIKLINMDDEDIMPRWIVVFYVLSPVFASLLFLIYGIATYNIQIALFSSISFFWFIIGAKCMSINEKIQENQDITDEIHTNTILLFRRYKSFLWSKIRGKKFVRFDFINDSYIINEGMILKQGWIMKDSKFVKRLNKYEN